jgi:hypothetical protein
MNTPEINTRGSRTTFSMDMMSPGLSVGYEAKSVPMEAMQNDVRNRPKARGMMSMIGVPKIRIPAIKGTQAMPKLYKNPLMLSPRTTLLRETGAERSRSKVFVLRSMGIDTGSIDDAENRMVMAMRPGIRTVGPEVLLTEKARNIKRGKSMPETTMFGLM